MANQFHFISGLPRSGSTLLGAVLRQNPRFDAGMTSPVGSLLGALQAHFSAGSEFGPVVEVDVRRRLLWGLFDSYYGARDGGARDGGARDGDRVVFDSNRCWCAKLPSVKDLYPGAKVIACVRNVAWVMDSIERLYRANPFENTKLFNDDVERNTVYSRVETLAQGGRLVGFAYNALKEAYYGEHADSLLLVEYELLTQAPEKVMRLIYEFLGERWFEHDFANVAYDAPAFDQALGLAGLHRVRPVIAPEPRRSVLPPDLFEQYSKLSFWHDGRGSAAHVIRAQTSAACELPAQRMPLQFKERSHASNSA
jgi:sulfotransferase